MAFHQIGEPEERQPPPEGPERVESGIPRLDYILKGGFLKGGTYNLIGPPGSGKTILGNQLCFNHIGRAGGRCVYISLLVESHAKMLRHLASLKFFDTGMIPERLYYVSGYSALREGGPDALLELIRATLRDRQATLLVVDGMESIRQFAEGEQKIKEFVHELQAFTALIGCTSLLMCFKDPSYSFTENAVVDGVIELSDQLIGPRAVRELVVHKFRGGDYLRGRHEVEITEGGIVIHPRTEIQFDKPPGQATEQRIRMPFGVAELDRMLFGGLPSGSTTALLGAPGTGKTLLGLSFLVEGARQGHHGTYFGFYEPPPRLLEKAGQVGIELEKYVEEGLIDVVWQPPLEHMLDSLAEQLLEKIREHQKPRRRLFFDGVEGFRAASVYPDRLPRFLSAFCNQLRASDVTAVMTEELPLFRPEIDMPNPELANVVETVILLRYVELRSQLYRLLSIMKMRESRYDTSIREFRITDEGLDVAASFESAEAILTGLGRATAAPSVKEDQP
ncbi:Circadian clock protein kinase KaiC [Aquisphaera giovannonii]|uniref:non-specific serine/threonine protein kinase n=1 Tax=Aquisphaera giovannonii TaxID=406548 RepID=A0A5B9WAM4_9BACT|nr:ATPase domain-containing protein [Aquisphaera giovannonii]QEH37626.1 Circadian clock protein kinase KaiC [Aquisphaera giovannonii]